MSHGATSALGTGCLNTVLLVSHRSPPETFRPLVMIGCENSSKGLSGTDSTGMTLCMESRPLARISVSGNKESRPTWRGILSISSVVCLLARDQLQPGLLPDTRARFPPGSRGISR
jgi:hypothetical protein